MNGQRYDGWIFAMGAVLFCCGGRSRFEPPGPTPAAGAVETSGTRFEPAATGDGGRMAMVAEPPNLDHAVEPAAGAGGAPGAAGSSAAGGGGVVPTGDDACAAPPPSLRSELAWRQELGTLYGLMGHGELSFSPDGSRLVTPADQYVLSGYTVRRASDGVMLESGKLALFG